MVYGCSEVRKMKFSDRVGHSDTTWVGYYFSIEAPSSIQIFEMSIMIIIMWISEIWMEAGAPMEGIEPPHKVSECQNANPHH